MAGHLRFTPGEHGALTSACRHLSPGLSYRDFQSELASRLRHRPELARRVGSLRPELLRTLRTHLQPAGREAAGGFGLSWRECKQLAELCALYCLKGCPPAPLRDVLLELAGPELAPKVQGLSDGQLAALSRRAQSGVRWCP